MGDPPTPRVPESTGCPDTFMDGNSEHNTRRMRSDGQIDPGRIVDRAAVDLADAGHDALRLGQLLDAAHRHDSTWTPGPPAPVPSVTVDPEPRPDPGHKSSPPVANQYIRRPPRRRAFLRYTQANSEPTMRQASSSSTSKLPHPVQIG